MTMTLGWTDPGALRLNSVPSSNVEISVSCENIADSDLVTKSDPVCVLYINTTKHEATGSWEEVGRTERIMDTLNPVWQKKFHLEYRFEEKQKLRFSIHDWDGETDRVVDHDFLGSAECSLGEVVAAGPGGYRSKLKGKSGTIVVQAEEVMTNRDLATVHFSAKNLDDKDVFSKSDPFFEMHKADGEDEYTLVYRSERVDNNLNPDWEEFEINIATLCNGDYDRELRINIFDHDDDGAHDIIGTVRTTLTNLTKEDSFKCMNEKKNKLAGTLIKNKLLIEGQHSFLDFIKGGTQINMNVAIDFTSSNGDPRDPKSLHYKDPLEKPNQYVTAIQAVGEIIQEYDLDKMFDCLGFGARLFREGEVSHAFPLSLDEGSYQCFGIDGIISTYYSTLQKINLYGPTHFAPVIEHFTKVNCSNGEYDYKVNRKYLDPQSKYCVLLILTDGLILDMEATKKAIIFASELPLSIIIVGVGNEDFTAMKALDSDKGLLECDGETAKRDIVQFVEMRKFVQPGYGWDKKQLAKAVLAEIPSQLVNYMKLHHFKPMA